MGKHKKQSKAQKRKATTARGKARKVSKSAPGKAMKRAVAKAKTKRAPVKKAARKLKRPVAPVVETVAIEVVEQPAPDIIAVKEVEGPRQVS
jgi:hypothetical protein